MQSFFTFLSTLCFIVSLNLNAIEQPNKRLVISYSEHPTIESYVLPLLRSTYAELGYDVKFVLMPAKRGLTELENGNIDGDATRILEILKQMSHVTIVGTELARSSTLLVCQKDVACQSELFHNPAALLGVSNLQLPESLGIPNITIKTILVSNLEHKIELLHKKRIDAFVEHFEQDSEHLQAVKALFNTVELSQSTAHHVLHERHAELAKLVEQKLNIKLGLVKEGDSNTLLIGTPLYTAQTHFGQTIQQLLRQIYAEVDSNLVFQELPSKRALMQTNQGIFDGDQIRFESVVNPETYPNLVALKPAMALAKIYLVCLTEDACEQKDNLRIGYLERFISMIHFCSQHQLKCMPLNEQHLGFKELDADLINAMLLSAAEAPMLLQQRKLYLREVKELQVPLYHYVHKKHAALLPALSVGLTKLIDSGQIQTLSEQIWQQVNGHPNSVLLDDL